MERYIERIEIVSFGKLKQLVLEPQPGMNLLVAPNESGKSTLASFLRFVLYGFSDSRKKELSENDKKRYTPWDTPLCEGSVTVYKDGKHYRVTRSHSSGSKETVSMTDRDTGREVYAGIEPGVFLFGVGEEVFSRTLFFKQLTLPQSKDELMAEQLQNLAVSADEQIGSKKALDRLTKAKNELKGRAGAGWIPRLEQEQARLEGLLGRATQEKQELDELRSRQASLRQQLAANRESRARVEAELENAKKWDALKQKKRLDALQAEVLQAKQACDAVEQPPVSESELTELLALCAEQKNALSAAREAEAACDLPAPDAPRAEKSKKWLPLFLFGLVLLLASGGLSAVGKWMFAIPAGIFAFVLLGVAFRAKSGDTKQKNAYAEKRFAYETQREQLQKRATEASQKAECLTAELTERLSPLGLSIGQELPEQLHGLSEALHRKQTLASLLQSSERAYALAIDGVDLAALERQASGATEPQRERSLIEREAIFLQQQEQLLSQKEAEGSTRIARMEGGCLDAAMLESKRNAVSQMLDTCKQRYTVYELARETIEQASDDMKKAVVPRLSELSSTYFGKMTDGKYRELRADARLALTFREDGCEREWDYLSAGTRDVAYLALRLSLAELLFEGNGMPFVLDDAFGRLDDSRLASLLHLLHEAAAKHQLLLLCCTDREQKLLERDGLPFYSLRV